VSSRRQFAANLRAHRQRKGLSQEALGYRAGLHRTEISLLERARRDPRLETLEKLARALEIPVSDLVEGIP
jgi:transcriptional regulator with XRE-family HTH domain